MVPRRILVIDDEEDIREVAQLSLRLSGSFEVLTASTGLEGIARAAAERPDAILLDVMMPGMDGPTTVRALLDEPATRDIPIILLTGRVQDDGPHPYGDLAVAAVIPKPFDPIGLSAQVVSALGWAP